jgi:2-polyprenyl-3-methyl-5-hydroxy-6-metoxy-1,4-benzoquinol methylase
MQTATRKDDCGTTNRSRRTGGAGEAGSAGEAGGTAGHHPRPRRPSRASLLPLPFLMVGCAVIGIHGWIGLASAEPAQTQPAQRPAAHQSAEPTSAAGVYQTTRPSPDGIGKVYMGREIAQVMGHLGAEWLERPEREREERPRKAIEMMGLKGDEVVADIGAGSGYFSFRIAKKLPRGKVLANDIQPEMLDLVKKTAKENGVTNVEPVLGTEQEPKLPEGAVDVVLMVDSYHEFDHPREMMLAIVKALKPGGRVVDVEYRGEDPKVEIKPHHKKTEAQARKEMEAVGLKWVKTLEDLPQQHMLIFQKPGESEKPQKPEKTDKTRENRGG